MQPTTIYHCPQDGFESKPKAAMTKNFVIAAFSEDVDNCSYNKGTKKD